MRRWQLFLVLVTAGFGCANTVGGDGEGGSSSSTTGYGGGAVQCEGKPCGTPCATCYDPPCEDTNQVCDNGECIFADYVTCTACPNYETDSPTTGENCPYVGLLCEYPDYGDTSVLVDCRRRYLCDVNGWETAHPDGYDCGNWEGGTCPMNVPEEDTDCDPVEYVDMCDYGEGHYCGCSRCKAGNCDGTVGKWGCVYPPAAPCPLTAPYIGHQCSEEELTCQYGECWMEQDDYPQGADLVTATRVCSGGMWIDTTNCTLP